MSSTYKLKKYAQSTISIHYFLHFHFIFWEIIVELNGIQYAFKIYFFIVLISFIKYINQFINLKPAFITNIITFYHTKCCIIKTPTIISNGINQIIILNDNTRIIFMLLQCL